MRIAIAIGAVLLVAVGLIVGRVTTPSVTYPTTLSAEAGFARDMQVHHQQAIDMAMTVREQTTDPEIRQLAYDIATSQGQQAGQMYAWLNLWGLPQASPTPQMTWMTLPTLDQNASDHGMNMGSTESTPGAGDAFAAGATMPGMASAADLSRLGTLTGVDAEKLFLTLMIAHHKGGVEMAKALDERSTDPNVLALANSIIKAQTSEIGYMTELLAARG
ncbi:hypothetical protein B7R25_10260 [Subtercola boreus]|uniref:DUF305 domain-containing protein n=2 Tax=Subtercola boreus TaxID=120213 RepID=A0A3E0W9J9_9MICO|nr:hypothetical protein B7R24_10195 [Subtercola boreus]RFA20512.1 hypothetical protein B7R23_10135 [Subtercola boreus]RFA26761.1 hypothetical protein B7R25_10260 [Subtercola boreus]